jgi:hypothetical protein
MMLWSVHGVMLSDVAALISHIPRGRTRSPGRRASSLSPSVASPSAGSVWATAIAHYCLKTLSSRCQNKKGPNLVVHNPFSTP